MRTRGVCGGTWRPRRLQTGGPQRFGPTPPPVPTVWFGCGSRTRLKRHGRFGVPCFSPGRFGGTLVCRAKRTYRALVSYRERRETQPPRLGDGQDGVAKPWGVPLVGQRDFPGEVCLGRSGPFRSNVATSAGACWSRVPRPAPAFGPLSCFPNSDLADLHLLPQGRWLLRPCSPFAPGARPAGLVCVTPGTPPWPGRLWPQGLQRRALAAFGRAELGLHGR